MFVFTRSPPGWLGFFGEQGYVNVPVLVQKCDGDRLTQEDAAEVKRVHSLFPEGGPQIFTVDSQGKLGHYDGPIPQ